MQTFLPYTDFVRSVGCLDRARLGKQRVEAIQILSVLLGRRWIAETNSYVPVPMEELGWSNHPAVRMWSGHEGSLYNYMHRACDAWVARGYHDSLKHRATMHLFDHIQPDAWIRPSWLTEEFCSSHRSILLAKDPVHYGQFGWTELPATKDLQTNRWPYPWPVSTRTNRS